ncbi:hypothetical protein BDW71DRAFT_196484 [Aspergillus fruticulosus]
MVTSCGSALDAEACDDREVESEAGSDVPQPSTATTNEHLYDYDQCIAALEGRSVPGDLALAAARCAAIRGLRCSYEFAMSKDIREMCATSRFPEFVRARNARLIMSNVVPDGLEVPEAQPYCIWNPDFANEDTYRQVAQPCPSMRYQQELDLLPDVSIAEEARDGHTEGGDQIYILIMSSPINYAHYTLSEDATEECGPEELDIEEDKYIGLHSDEADIARYDEFNPQEATLSWEPLPLDIPTMKKNMLFQMAAFEGNVDRCARLISRRSQKDIFSDEVEMLCVAEIADKERYKSQAAINARRIMIGGVGTFTKDTPCLPWLIWYPLKRPENSLYSLSKRCPSMHVQIVIACIYATYKGLYERLNLRPCIALMETAEKTGNLFYKEDIEKRAAELGIDGLRKEGPWIELFHKTHDPLTGGYYKKNFAYGGCWERYVFLSFETIRNLEVEGYIEEDGRGKLFFIATIRAGL